MENDPMSEQKIDIEHDEEGGVTIEIDGLAGDDEESAFDLDAESGHLEGLDRKYTVPPDKDDDEDKDDEPATRQARRPDPGDADDKEFDDGYEHEKASDKVRKRVGNLTRRRKLADSARAEAEADAHQARQEAAEANTRYNKLVNDYVDDSVEQTEEDLERFDEEMKTALEAGDTDKQVKITGEIIDARTKLNMAKLRTPRPDPEDEPAPAAQPVQPQAVQPTSQARDWFQRNRTWYNDPNYAYVNVAARQVDKEMTAEKWPRDDTYFEELDRRLVDKIPDAAELVDFDAAGETDDDPPARKPARRPAPKGRNKTPVAGVNTEGGRKAGGSKVKLTPADLRTIEEVWGEDPNDPVVLKAFAESKRDTAIDFKERGHDA